MWLYRGYRAEILLEVEELDRLDYCPQCGVKGEVVVNRMGCPECGASW
jgi:Zn finger protein HypA/HybF involved in hydrogenase expression